MKKLLSVLCLLFFLVNANAQTDNNLNLSNNNMLNMGAISVTIGGEFIITGTFPASITDRVDAFITRMYNRAKQEMAINTDDPTLLKQMDKKLNNYVLRDITLKRASGEILHLDLQKFRLNGDFSNNPYLKNDDIIIFPQPDLEDNSFTISGAVNNPGKFFYMDGDHLQDALELAQGINKAYENISAVEIHRLNNNGDEIRIIHTDIKSNPPLERGDGIIVVAKEIQKKGFSVIVAGEVNNPGRIPVTKNTTTIKEVIEYAGGLKEDASLRRSELFTGNSLPILLKNYYGISIDKMPELFDRNLNYFFLRYQNLMMLRLSNLEEKADSAYFMMENDLRLSLERGPVDFTKLYDSSSNVSKYIVNDGDVIIIPRKEKTIYVFGQVIKPGKVNYTEGKDYNYYIAEAGGKSKYAQDDVMLIKADTKEWISLEENKASIEEGDYLYVPRIIKKPLLYYVQTASIFLSIVGSLATIALLIISLK